MDAATEVWDVDDATALDTLSVLLDGSLVSAVPGDTDVRFWMLQTLRSYAGERLAAHSDAEETRRRHAHCYAARSKGANRGLQSADHAAWTRRLAEDFPNLRAAMGWLLANGEYATVAAVGWELFIFWWLHAHVREAAAWMREALDQGEGLDLVEARLYWTVGALASQMGEFDVADTALEQARTRLAQLGDVRALGATLLLLAPAAARRGDLDEAGALSTEAAKLLREHDSEFGYGIGLSILGTIALVAGRLDEALDYHGQALEVGEELGSETLVAQSQNELGFVELQAGNLELARELMEQGARGHLGAGGTEGIALTLEGFAALALTQGEHRRAAMALAHAAMLRERIALPPWALLTPFFEAAHQTIRDALGEEEYIAALAEGRAMSRREAIECAMDAPLVVP